MYNQTVADYYLNPHACAGGVRKLLALCGAIREAALARSPGQSEMSPADHIGLLTAYLTSLLSAARKEGAHAYLGLADPEVLIQFSRTIRKYCKKLKVAKTKERVTLLAELVCPFLSSPAPLYVLSLTDATQQTKNLLGPLADAVSFSSNPMLMEC